MKRWIASLAVPVVLIASAAPALAARRGGGNAAPSGACTVGAGAVDATGLPTTEVINFMITDSSGTSGWVLGYTADGTWSVSVPPANGATTYEFVSRTWGPNGSKYTVFASCS